MKQRYIRIVFCLLIVQTNFPVSLVYNLRVRRVFNVPRVIEQKKPRYLLQSVPIVFTRKSTVTSASTMLETFEKRRAGGSLFNFRFIPNRNWFAEATTGIEKDSGSFTGNDPFCAARTGFDDLVLAGGYRHFIGKKGQLVGYGLVGLPTRRKITADDRQGPLVGTRVYNIGVGAEGSYAFISELRRSFAAIMQVRFIHGFNREWEAISGPGSELQPGNSVDSLFTLQYRNRRTVYEAGYDLTTFFGQAIILPTEKRSADTLIRHSVYASMSHIVFNGPFDKPLVYGTGVSISRSKKLDVRTITAWVHAGIVF